MEKQPLEEFIQKHGPWSADNIQLGENLFTRSPDDLFKSIGILRTVQLIQDLSAKPLDQLRILDLGCLEGGYALELALHGAEVVGIEGRAASIEKARFSQRALGLNRVTFLQEDVRNLSVARHGTFDVVLCFGILYHLDAPDVFRFLEAVYQVCRHFVIFQTHVALHPRQTVSYGPLKVRGWRYREHLERDPDFIRQARLWGSLDNPWSFWMDPDSLRRVLYRVGFTSVLKLWPPREVEQVLDRVVLAAFKGKPESFRSIPGVSNLPEADPKQAILDDFKASPLSPKVLLRRMVSRMLGRLGLEVIPVQHRREGTRRSGLTIRIFKKEH